MNIGFLVIALVAFIAVMMMSQRTRRQQMNKQNQTLESLEPGTWVMTGSGFYGRFVEIDGDVLVLENSQGTESLWDRRAFAAVKEPPFAPADNSEENSSLSEKTPEESLSKSVSDSVELGETEQTSATEENTEK